MALERQVMMSRKAWCGAAAPASVLLNVLLGEQAPGSTRMESSLIVDDEPGVLNPCKHENHRREPGGVLEQNKCWFLTSDRSVPTRESLERRTGKIPGDVPKGTRAPASQVIKDSIPP